MKTCYECLSKKQLSDFYKNSAKNDGYEHICKECSKARAKKYLNNRSTEETNQQIVNKKLHYERNKESILLKKKEYYIAHADTILEKRREYAKINKGKIKNTHAEYYNRNRERISNVNKKNYTINRDAIINRNVKYEMIRRENDPYYKFYRNLKCRFKNAMELYTKNGKVNSCREYGIDFKKIYEKIGPCPGKGYHLDHIIPLKLFDLNNNEHVRLAHLPVNLRWISANNNLVKSAKIPNFVYSTPELLKILVAIGKDDIDEKGHI